MDSDTQPTTECVSAFKDATAALIYVTHEYKIMKAEFAPELLMRGSALVDWLHDANVKFITDRGEQGFMPPEGYEFVCYRYRGKQLARPIFMIDLKAKQ